MLAISCNVHNEKKSRLRRPYYSNTLNIDRTIGLKLVEAGDREGCPLPETLEALKSYPLQRNDQNGWIELATGGERMWVEVENIP